MDQPDPGVKSALEFELGLEKEAEHLFWGVEKGSYVVITLLHEVGVVWEDAERMLVHGDASGVVISVWERSVSDSLLSCVRIPWSNIVSLRLYGPDEDSVS